MATPCRVCVFVECAPTGHLVLSVVDPGLRSLCIASTWAGGTGPSGRRARFARTGGRGGRGAGGVGLRLGGSIGSLFRSCAVGRRRSRGARRRNEGFAVRGSSLRLRLRFAPRLISVDASRHWYVFGAVFRCFRFRRGTLSILLWRWTIWVPSPAFRCCGRDCVSRPLFVGLRRGGEGFPGLTTGAIDGAALASPRAWALHGPAISTGFAGAASPLAVLHPRQSTALARWVCYGIRARDWTAPFV